MAEKRPDICVGSDAGASFVPHDTSFSDDDVDVPEAGVEVVAVVDEVDVPEAGEVVVVVDDVEVDGGGGVEPPQPPITVATSTPMIAVRQGARRPSGRTTR